jgi:hypothetical protein
MKLKQFLNTSSVRRRDNPVLIFGRSNKVCKFQPFVLQQILVSEDYFPFLTDYPLVSPTEDQM